MQSSPFHLGESGSDQLVARRPETETPEFDITAMVDLVFMMNIYFLVTFVTVALSELNLPHAARVSALDAESAVIVHVVPTLDGKSVTVAFGEKKDDQIGDVSLQEKRIQDAVEQGRAAGKTEVLLKAEKKVRLTDLFRIAMAASADGMRLNVAVLEREKQ
jgi:biopolymer transport protein ExbD